MITSTTKTILQVVILPVLAVLIFLAAIFFVTHDDPKPKPKKSVVTTTQVEHLLKESALRNNRGVRVTAVDCVEQDRNFFRCVVATDKRGHSYVLVRFDEQGVGTVQPIAPPLDGPSA